MTDKGFGHLTVAVEGCCHGELDAIYETIRQSEERAGVKVDLLLICGDFESIRNERDLSYMAVPNKYRTMNTFHEYMTGLRSAPVMTIFIGGNHEASNYLHSLYYGGFVAPNIYFLGFAGSIWYGGIRIAGLSGIYNSQHYRLGHFEKPPYDQDMIRSIYHIRELEIYRLAHLCNSASPIDVFLSHDWPQGIWDFGDKQQLFRMKRFLKEDIDNGKLGGPPLMQLLHILKPDFWCAAHFHVKFAALVPHKLSVVAASATSQEDDKNDTQNVLCVPVEAKSKSTRFLALDKVIPGRDYLQILKIPRQCAGENVISFDPEWLVILKNTHDLLSTSNQSTVLPEKVHLPTAEEIDAMKVRVNHVNGGLNIQAPDQSYFLQKTSEVTQEDNQQTDKILDVIEKEHIWTASTTSPKSLKRPLEVVSSITGFNTIEQDSKRPAISSSDAKVSYDSNEVDIDSI